MTDAVTKNRFKTDDHVDVWVEVGKLGVIWPEAQRLEEHFDPKTPRRREILYDISVWLSTF